MIPSEFETVRIESDGITTRVWVNGTELPDTLNYVTFSHDARGNSHPLPELIMGGPVFKPIPPVTHRE